MIHGASATATQGHWGPASVTINAASSHPAATAVRDVLMTLDPARGLKALFESHAAEVTCLSVDDANVLVDVDTPDDYVRTRD